MQRLDTIQDLCAAVDRLLLLEPRFAIIVERHGLPPLRHADPGLESLLRIVTDQLISLRAGEAIWSRLAARFGQLTPERVLEASEADLRSMGLSGAKARTFLAAAHAFRKGRFAASAAMGEDDMFRSLTAIRGIGPWTASIYLMMAEHAADAWPAADLALQCAAEDLFALPARPSAREMAALAEAWRPCRSAAALLLWRHYRALRGIAAG
jgi:DNA-3-methyladenine glycosylase II